MKFLEYKEEEMLQGSSCYHPDSITIGETLLPPRIIIINGDPYIPPATKDNGRDQPTLCVGKHSPPKPLTIGEIKLLKVRIKFYLIVLDHPS